MTFETKKKQDRTPAGENAILPFNRPQLFIYNNTLKISCINNTSLLAFSKQLNKQAFQILNIINF